MRSVEVAAGGSVIDPKVVEVLVRRTSGPTSPLDSLTDRERDVLAQMATGADNAAIASALVLTVSVGREVHQRHLQQARTQRGDRRQPAREGRARVSRCGLTPPTRSGASTPRKDRLARCRPNPRSRRDSMSRPLAPRPSLEGDVMDIPRLPGYPIDQAVVAGVRAKQRAPRAARSARPSTNGPHSPASVASSSGFRVEAARPTMSHMTWRHWLSVATSAVALAAEPRRGR